MNKKYIKPRIYTERSGVLEDILSENTSSNSNQTVLHQDLLSKERLLVLGEPGYGKSRLLKELLFDFEGEEKSCCFLGLKYCGTDLVSYIKQESAKKRRKNKIPVSKIKFYATESFQLKNDPNIVLILDALDEVSETYVIDLLEDIVDLVEEYSEITLIISCRTKHLQKLGQDDKLSDFTKFEFVKIASFDAARIIDYLVSNSISKEIQALSKNELEKKLEDAHLVSSSFRTYWRKNETLKVPRYLEMFTSLIDSDGLEKTMKLGRSELFDRFIEKRLRLESDKGRRESHAYKEKVSLVKQALERLALLMEIQRVNTISMDNFSIFIHKTEHTLLHQLDLSVIVNRTILKSTYEELEFDNTEFQEFLAAKAITRFENSKQVAFNLAIEKSIGGVYHTWTNVLNHLIELNSKLLFPFIELAIHIRDKNLLHLVGYPNDDYFKKNEEERSQIFNNILSYCKYRTEWLDESVAYALSSYFIPYIHHLQLLSDLQDLKIPEEHPHKGNILVIMEYVLAREILNESEKEKWKSVLLKRLRLPFEEEHGYIITHVIDVLKEILSIQKLDEVLENHKESKRILGTLVRVLQEKDVNHPLSVERKLDYFFFNKRMQDSTSFVVLLTKKQAFITLYEYLNNRYINKQLINYGFKLGGHGLNQFIQNLSILGMKTLKT